MNLLTRHFDSAFREDSQDLIAESPQIRLEDRHKALQIRLQAAGALLADTQDK